MVSEHLARLLERQFRSLASAVSTVTLSSRTTCGAFSLVAWEIKPIRFRLTENPLRPPRLFFRGKIWWENFVVWRRQAIRTPSIAVRAKILR